MRKNILLPTDFSDNSWNAIIYALKLYAEEDCTFYLLNSIKIKVSTASNFSKKIKRVIEEKSKKELLRFKEQAVLTNTNANHEFKIILRSENLEQSIDIAIDKYHINLVVMGTQGATGAKEFFFGSNTVKAIEKARLCPVLAVPDGYDFIIPKQIAFSTDLNRFYDFLDLKPLRDLADLYHSKIRIFHVNQEEHLSEIQEHNCTTLKEYLKEYEHDFYWMPAYTKKEKEINDFILDLDINILVMINYKHSFIEGVIKEPVIKKIGFHPIIPFFVIPE
jgi:nucleotide-binding universal stress UspA family protein